MDAKAIVHKGIERWNAHDRGGFLDLVDDDLVFVDQATGRRLVGAEEFVEGFYDVWTEAYPDNELKDAIVFAEGDLVCFQGRFVGTNTGVFRGPEMQMPPTGKPIDTPFVFVVEVGDDKMKHAWHYYDRLLAFEQEGLVSADQLMAQLAAR